MIKKLPRTSWRPIGASDDVPVVQALGKTLDKTGDNIGAHDADPSAVKEVNTADECKRIAQRWAELVQDLSDPVKRAEFLAIRKGMKQVESVAIGYHKSMPLLSLPTNWDLLIAAVENAIKEKPNIVTLTKLPYDGIDIGEMQQGKDALVFICECRTQDEQAIYVDNVTASHLITSLDGQVRRIFYSYSGATSQLPQGSTALADTKGMRVYISSAAQLGLETKKTIQKVESATETRVLGEVAANQGTPPGAGGPGSSGPPPPATSPGSTGHPPATGGQGPVTAPAPPPKTTRGNPPAPKGSGKAKTTSRKPPKNLG